jgi:hypothetical protein
MKSQRSNPFRGLLAGLLALVAFASFAVAMATGRSTSTTANVTQTPAATQTLVRDEDGGGRGFIRGGDGDGRRR